jgi:hypothetical protein
MQRKGIDPSEGPSNPKSIYFFVIFYNKRAGITVHLNICTFYHWTWSRKPENFKIVKHCFGKRTAPSV